ncbi:aminopeptidase N-like [Homarus americanus]|uniref:aminopeptidase N-like n=1 Tax=Homarus americanus TaxID=6706 RepID=UPI001C455D71|nr:aminopeptidase N-like [Homarus americanus]
MGRGSDSLLINHFHSVLYCVQVTPSDNLEGPTVEIKHHSYDNKREFYIAHLNKKLAKGKKYVLSMEFNGTLNDQLKGFYRSSYKDTDGYEKKIATTQFQPTDARRAFPCFDEPGLKATFEIFLARETSMTSISNMPKFETIPVEGQPGWLWDHFNTSVPMSTYLVAFVVSDFDHMESNANERVLFRVKSRPAAIKQATYALKTGPTVLTFFEKYFNIPFPLPKQDMIAIPDFSAGAMENWGLITYRETAMLYDPAVSAAYNKQRVAVVVAHELAHQWFGNLVTPDWWTDLWLNEGFASFMEYIGVDHAEPSWNMMEQFVPDDLQSVFALDWLESSHPVSIPVGHPDEINEIFDRISYSKGASIIRMMNHFLTESTFRRGLTNYLSSLKFANAEQDDLWRFLTDAAHEDGTLPLDTTVKKVMDTWTLQMGYPVINVMRSAAGTSASVSQERFLLVKNENSTDTHKYKWWVPLTYTTQDNSDFDSTQAMVWMKDTDAKTIISSLPKKDKWVIFNIQETGYYRVNYDEDNWNLLIQQLKTNHKAIHVINRAQIIDDAMDLARAGQLSYNIALSVYAYLGKEEAYVPWKSALANLEYVKHMFSSSGTYGALKSYMIELLVPLYRSVGFEDNVNDPHLDQFKRVRAVSWACKLNYKDCVDNAVSLFRQWMQNPVNQSNISPNLKNTVYCTAIATGGVEEWNFGWNQYLKSNVGTEKATLLAALGCSKKIWILSRYMDMAFTAGSGIRKQDAGTAFRSVARNNVGRYLAWNYLRDKWQKIIDYYGSGLFTIPRIIETATSGLNTKLELKELELFKKEHAGGLGTAKRAVEQAIERTTNNIAWVENNYSVIIQWLEDHGYSALVNEI